MKRVKLFLKFCTVGLSGTTINLIIYSCLIYLVNFNYILAAAIAFFVAASNNFLWNFLWTFKGKAEHKSIKKKYASFLAISLVSFSINLVILYFCVEFLGSVLFLRQFLSAYFSNIDNIIKMISQILGIGVSVVINFIGNYLITFSKNQPGL